MFAKLATRLYRQKETIVNYRFLFGAGERSQTISFICLQHRKGCDIFPLVVENVLALQEQFPSLRMVVKSEHGIEKRILIVLHLDWNINDRTVLEALSPQTVQIKITDDEKSIRKEYLSFERLLLVSKSKEKIIITMSGYSYTGKVSAEPWKDSEACCVIRQIELEHVEGFEAARARHNERITGNNLDSLTLEDAQRIYETILSNVPCC